MKQNKLLYLLLLVVSCVYSMSLSAKKASSDVYMFGFAASFSDSVIYMTDIQTIHGVVLEKKSKVLPLRSSYSYQFKSYVESNSLLQKSTCSVFFAPTRSKLEKKYIKLRKKYSEDKNVILKFVGSDSFMFLKAQEYNGDSE